MKLNVAERLLILGLDTLPAQGNLVTMRMLAKLMEKVGFKEEEIEKYEIKQEGTTVTWKGNPDPVEVNLSDAQKEMVKKALEQSDTLTLRHTLLADRFGVAEKKDE